MPLHVRTPVWDSPALSRAFGAPVWLKMDALQPVGSFKIRGLGSYCSELVAQGAAALISSSGGNAGYAVAYAGRKLGVPTHVVVPRRTSEQARQNMRDEGAEVLEHGEIWDDAHARALELAEQTGGAYVHPFDAPSIWRGHASIIEEVAAERPAPGAVVVSVGGGGLLCGVLTGMHAAGWQDVPVLAVETEGAASFALAVQAGGPADLAEVSSLATTLGARRVCQEAWEWTQRHAITAWQVSDRQAVEACLRFADSHRVLVEPSCGAALASVYQQAEPLRDSSSVLVIVCGGAGVDRGALRGWQKQVDLVEKGDPDGH